MILVDSCGWIEFFKGGTLASRYYEFLKDESKLIVPTIVICEVYKILRRELGKESATMGIGHMHYGAIVPLKTQTAVLAGELSLEHKLPLADAIVYATAIEYDASLITGDKHLRGLPRVKFIEK